MQKIGLLHLIILLGIFAGCSQLQGPYQRPSSVVTDTWKEEDDSKEDVTLDEWWTVFNDSTLDDLIEQSIQHNQTVAAAYNSIGVAYAQGNFQKGALFPHAAFNPFYFRAGLQYPSNIFSVPGFTFPSRIVDADYSVPINFTWQIDLWGKLTQSYLNAYYTFQQEQFSYLDALNQVTSDVAVNYYLLRGYDTEIEVLNRIIADRKENLEINQDRYQAGFITYLDVSQAEFDLASALAEKENVVRERKLQENIIAVLIGKPASAFCLPFMPFSEDMTPPKIPLYLPSELLTRRPDIGASERAVAAAHANIGVAYANFFPSVNLYGSLGFSSFAIQTLFDWQSRLWLFATSVAQVLFDAGQTLANADQAVYTYYRTINRYQQSVLEGIRDVENALANIDQREKQYQALLVTVEYAQQTYLLAKDRFDSGFTNYLTVVIAERDLLVAERSAAVINAQRFADAALLIKALGGGWE